jgi:phosphatidylserine/phosphatidylglycerophosphate/cardiolipin synthase-like enzyme
VKRLIFILLLLLLVPACPEPQPPGPLPPVEIYFSPHGGCTEAVVREIDAARSGILVQAYSFTSAPIAKALVEAHKRGVAIEVILDDSQESEKYSSADFLLHAGIPVRIDAKHAIAHNKIMIFDGEVVITGSFNFTKQAEQSNAENLLVIRDKPIADRYTANWQSHAAHSEPYEKKEPARGRREGR